MFHKKLPEFAISPKEKKPQNPGKFHDGRSRLRSPPPQILSRFYGYRMHVGVYMRSRARYTRWFLRTLRMTRFGLGKDLSRRAKWVSPPPPLSTCAPARITSHAKSTRAISNQSLKILCYIDNYKLNLKLS